MKLMDTIIVLQLLICGLGITPCSTHFEQGQRSSEDSGKQSAVPEHHDSSSFSKDDQSISTEPTETKMTTFKEFWQGPHRGSSSTVTLPPLPFGVDTFDVIRKRKKFFVDKTPFISELIKEDNPKLYVLTRPKRFGKSVFLEMLRRFLEGEEEYFKDTAIATRGNGLTADGKWDSYPVIYIDFVQVSVSGTATQFTKSLRDALEDNALSYKLKVRSNINVGNLILDLKRKYNETVSILIDNYDRPMMNDELPPRVRKQIKSILADFYEMIRGNVNNIRLCLAIGISKLNILSNGQSRFTDLTFDKRFASAIGFSSKEVEQHLRPYFKSFAVRTLSRENDVTISSAENVDKVENDAKTWYGGHQFAVSKEILKTLNPASTCECLRKKKFGDYMGNTNLISIIKNKMTKNKKTMEDFENLKMEVRELERFNLGEDEISLQLFMLYNGILTIKNYNKKSNTVSLGYPNEEIRKNLKNELPQELVGEDQKGHSRLKSALMKNDVDTFVYLLNEYIFHRLSQSVNIPLTEFVTTRQILTVLKATEVSFKEGEILWGNDEQNKGDLDLRIMLPKSELVIGMKYKKSGADSILALIRYVMENEDAFRSVIGADKNIFLLGMNIIPLTKKGDIVTTAEINQWVLLPYRDGKIWMNEFQASPDIEDGFITHFKKRLNKNLKNYLNSPKIIW